LIANLEQTEMASHLYLENL